MKKFLLTKMLLVAAALLMGTSAWADEWSTVWSADFSSVPSGMTYSVTNGSTEISNGILCYHQSGSADRAINTAFTASAFVVATAWNMEFDLEPSSANTNASNVTFATNQGTAFTIAWPNWGSSVVTITDASGTELTTTLPFVGYNKGVGDVSTMAHYTVTGDPENGVYLTVARGGATYVNNVKVTSTFGYPATLNGTLGKAVSHMYVDNIVFQTPSVAGYVAPPTGTITAPDGTNRKFTLSCLTDGATIYYATSDLAIGADGWTTYSSEVSTSATTIYTYAKKGDDTSEKSSFATGAGTAITLNAPSLTKTAYSDGSYTVSISSNQSNLALVPASTTIYYSIDGGAATAYSSPVAVSEGSTISAHVTATGYANSSDAETTPGVMPSFSSDWSVDFTSISSTEYSDETFGSTYYKLINNSTSAVVNDNFGVAAEEGGNKFWIHNGGLYVYYGSSRTFAINNLEEGDYIRITSSIATWAGSNVALQSDLCYGNVYIYKATADGIGIFNTPRYNVIYQVEILKQVASATIGSNGYATFASPYPLDLANLPAGLTAYKASVTGTTVTFTQVTEAVAANTGLLLQGTASTTYDIPVAASGSDISGTNAFLVNTSDATFAGEADYYYFGLMAGTLTFGTFDPSSVAIPANKAYLKVLKSSIDGAGARLRVVFGDDATAIIAPEASEGAEEATVYNLAGQRVNKPTKGIYIVNGKKVIVK